MVADAKKEPKKDEPALLTYLDALVDHLRRTVPKAMRGDDADAIHQARVATRRLKAAVDLLGPVLEEDRIAPFKRSLRRLRRRLGPLRDLDVMSGHLIELRIADDPERSAAIDWLAIRLQSARQNALQSAQEKSHSNKMLAKLGAWWGLREQIVDSEEAISPLLRDSLANQFAEFARASDGMIDGPTVGQVDPHVIRIAGKSLRYTVEMAQAHGVSVGGAVTKAFKRMQDALGLWHDYIVLTERMLSCSGDEKLAHHSAPTQRAILGLAQVTLKKSEQQLQKFATLWKSQSAVLAESIGMIHRQPLGAPEVMTEQTVEPRSTELKTDPDPADSAGTSAPAEPDPGAPEAA